MKILVFIMLVALCVYGYVAIYMPDTAAVTVNNFKR